MKLNKLLCNLVFCFGALIGHTVQAQELPEKPISLIVGFVPGGAADASARLIAKRLGQNTHRSIAVINKPGAGGNVAHQYVAKGPNDGSMLLLGSIGPLTVSPHMMDVGYEPFTDFAPISGSVNYPLILVTHNASGVRTLKEYLDLAKSHPEKVDFASPGFGSSSHMAGELLNMNAGVNIVHVPYKGGGQVIQDLLGERTMSYFGSVASTLPLIEERRLVPLATTGLKRPSYLPNVPTVSESGYPGFEVLNWYGFVAPADTPSVILDRWNEEIVKVLTDPNIVRQLIELGLTPQPTTRQEFADFMKKESAKWGHIIKNLSLKK